MSDTERLAKALYETAGGSNGYPPLHESIKWRDLHHGKDGYRDRARAILAKLGAPAPEGEADQ